MICASEQSVIVDKKVYKAVKDEFIARGCHFLTKTELDKVRKTILINGSLNAKIVGQSAYTIAKLAGVMYHVRPKFSSERLLLLTYLKNLHTKSFHLFLQCTNQTISTMQ